jgi:hypothetical protein
VVKTPEMNPFSLLKVVREGKEIRYVDQKRVLAG